MLAKLKNDSHKKQGMISDAISMGIQARLFWCVLLPCFVFGLNGCSNNHGPTEPGRQPAHASKESLDRGAQIISEYVKRDASPYRKSRARFTISSEQEPTKVYVVEIWRRQTDDETRALTHIIEPKAEEAASLITKKEGKPAVSVSYVSTTNQFRETGTNKMFFGGLTSQELLGEWDKYDSRFLSEKMQDGIKLFEVESTLKPEADSVIYRIVTLFRADDYLPTKLLLFNDRDEELRVFRITDTRTVEGHQVVWKTEIENHVYRTKILIELLNMTFAEKIPDEAFERDYLKRIAVK